MLLFPLAMAPLIIAAALAPSPCRLVREGDVVRVLHWNVRPGSVLEYHLPQTSGVLCKYEAPEGTVLVTVPDRGSSFFQNNDLVDPFKNGLGTRVTGIGASVTMFDNTAYVNKHGRSVSVAVLPADGAADERSLTAFAKLAAGRMP